MTRRDEEENPLSDVETYEMAEELADRMKLKPRERVDFIDKVMTRCGFMKVQKREVYEKIKVEEDDENERDHWKFGNGERKSASRKRENPFDDDGF